MIDPSTLVGVRFKAVRSCVQHYSGEAIVTRQKKSGMFECEGDNGEVFEDTKTVIVRSLMNEYREFMDSVPDKIEGFEEVGMDDRKFEIRAANWQKSFEKIAQDMAGTTNIDGQYPNIDFSPLQIEFQKIVTALRDSREKPSLIVVPGGRA